MNDETRNQMADKLIRLAEEIRAGEREVLDFDVEFGKREKLAPENQYFVEFEPDGAETVYIATEKRRAS